VKRAAEMLDEVEAVHIRLYESTESDDPISQWSPEVSFDEAISHPQVYRNRKFQLGKEVFGSRKVSLSRADWDGKRGARGNR